MSNQFKIEKVISTLPNTLSANTIYVVRVGTGYEMYVTDLTGEIAHKLNDEKITSLQNRKLNFENIIAVDPFLLDSVNSSYGGITLAEYVQTQQGFPETLNYNRFRILSGKTYRFYLTVDYTKVSGNDTLTIDLSNDVGNHITLNQINYSTYQSGKHTITFEYTPDNEYKYINIALDTIDSKLFVYNFTCYDVNDIEENDILDNTLPFSYTNLISTVFSFDSKINEVTGNVLSQNEFLKNQGVNLLYAEVVNPQSIYDYNNYLFDVPFQIIDSFEYGVNAWQFNLDGSNATSSLIFNPGGQGDTNMSRRLYLKNSKYLFSFYAKSSDSTTHFIKFEINSGAGFSIASKEFELNAGLFQYSFAFEAPESSYSIKIYVNSQGHDTTGKTLRLERMLLEDITYQNIDVENPINAKISSFSEPLKSLPKLITTNILDIKSRLNNVEINQITTDNNISTINTNITNLQTNKLDKSEYVQHFKGVYVSFASLSSTHPIATDGDYAHIDSGSGFDRMAAIWDSSDSKWIVQSVNVGSNTDEIPEGSVNLYHTSNRVRNTTLDGISFSNSNAVVNTDTVVQAFGKVQAQLNNSGAPTWVNINTLSSYWKHANVLTNNTKIEIAVIDKMLWIRGYFSIGSSVNSNTRLFDFNVYNTPFALDETYWGSSGSFDYDRQIAKIDTSHQMGETIMNIRTRFVTAGTGRYISINTAQTGIPMDTYYNVIQPTSLAKVM